jgi:hypothetical protein
MHVCLSMDSQIGTSGLAHAGPMIFALSVDICALGTLLGMSYNSAEEPHDD